MSEENINIATKEYTDAHFGNTSETNGDLVIATKEYVDSIPTGMRVDGTALKGQLCNTYNATTVGEGADGSTLTDGTYMFSNCSNLTSWTAELPNLTNGTSMFYKCYTLISFTGDLLNLENGEYMFQDCPNLSSCAVALPKLTNGTQMFLGCIALTSWTAELPNLTNGTSMFSRCYGLTSFSAGLPSLTDGNDMFYNCTGLVSWTVDLPNLENGYYMFSNCSNLTSFSGDLSKLEGTYSSDGGGYRMFYSCTSLKTFNSALPSLAYGQQMFYGCILNEASVLNILNSIPTHTDGKTHPLHLGKNTNYQTSDAVAAKLRTSTGGTVTTPIPAATNYRCVDDDGNDKGWTITVQA